MQIKEQETKSQLFLNLDSDSERERMPGLLGLGLDSLTIGVLSSVYGMDTFLCLLRAVCILSIQYVVRLLIEYAYYAYAHYLLYEPSYCA